ncbi:MAG: MFS transporter, partial [Solirubrobacteraceae bacterium]
MVLRPPAGGSHHGHLVGATASLIFSPLTERLQASLGWRDALLVLAATLGALAIPLHALVLRSAPDAGGTAPREHVRPRRQMLRSSSFWLLTSAFTSASFSTYAIVVHLVSLLIHGGSDAAFAAFVAGLLGISQLPGRLMFVVVSRRLGEAALPVAVFGLGAAALVLLARERSDWAAIVFAVSFGASNGMATLLRATLVADLWGRERYECSIRSSGRAVWRMNSSSISATLSSDVRPTAISPPPCGSGCSRRRCMFGTGQDVAGS